MTEKPPARATQNDADVATEQTSIPIGQGSVEAAPEEGDTATGAAVPAAEPRADTAVPAAEPGADAVPPTGAQTGVPTWTYDPAATPAPPAPVVPLAAIAPTPASLGIMGKHRMPGVVVVLTIVTLGFYGLVWHSRINREMSDFDTRMHVNSARSTWAVLLPWLAGVAATVAGALLLLSTQLNLAVPFGLTPRPLGWILLAGILAIPYLEFFFPLSLVACVMTAERVRICEDRVGLTTDVQLRPVAHTAWLLFPVLGGVIFIARLQTRLNGVWERVAPAASQRRRRS